MARLARLTALTAVMTLGSLVAMAPAGIADGATSESDAVAYQHDAAHDGRASVGIGSSLRQLWTVDLGMPMSYPLIAGGRLFVTVQENGNSSASELVAFNAKSGKRLWGPVQIGNGSVGPAYDAGRVFTLSYDGEATALDAATGKIVWRNQLSGFNDAAPTAYNGTLYFPESSAHNLKAVNATTGAVKWQAPVLNGDRSSPAVDGTGVYVAFSGLQTYRFSSTGKLVWHYAKGAEGGGGATPALANSEVFARDDAGSASPTAFRESNGTKVGSFASDTDFAFGASTFAVVQGSNLVGITTKTLKTKWSQPADGITVPPVVSGNVVYAATASAVVTGYDLSTGRQVWTAPLPSPVVRQPWGAVDELQGLATGDGVLAVPASTTLTVFGP